MNGGVNLVTSDLLVVSQTQARSTSDHRKTADKLNFIEPQNVNAVKRTMKKMKTAHRMGVL